MVLIRRDEPPPNAKVASATTWVTATGVVYVKRKDHVVRLPDRDLALARKVWRGDPPLQRRRGKLSPGDAAYIKGQLAVGCNKSWLAKKFGVTPQAIHKIEKGQLWSQVETPVLDLDGPPHGTHLSPDITAYYDDVYEG